MIAVNNSSNGEKDLKKIKRMQLAKPNIQNNLNW